MSETLDLARRALAAGDGETLARVTRERSLMLRFAHSRATQATEVDDITIEVAALHDGHVGRSSTNRTDTAALGETARAAAAAAREFARTAGAGRYPGFPPPAIPRGHSGHDPATARIDPATGGAALAEAFAATAAAGTEASGIWTCGEVETAIAACTGAELTDRVTDAFAKVIAFAPDGRSGYASQAAVATDALDMGELARRAAAKATLAGEVATLEPGEYPVVMEAPGVAEVLWVLAGTAFNGLAHAERRGALTDRLGTQVAAPAINLSDSPRHAATLPRAFDAEGVPKAPLPLIEDGVAQRVVHDTSSAAAAGGGATSTGHALTVGGSASGPMPTNLVLAGGGAAGETELCTPIERGIYVTRLWYTNVVRDHQALFTAVTRDGTFLIEDGRISRPLEDVRVTDGALDLLARVQALGARSVLTADGEFYGRRFATGSVCPPLRADTIRVTGTASGN